MIRNIMKSSQSSFRRAFMLHLFGRSEKAFFSTSACHTDPPVVPALPSKSCTFSHILSPVPHLHRLAAVVRLSARTSDIRPLFLSLHPSVFHNIPTLSNNIPQPIQLLHTNLNRGCKEQLTELSQEVAVGGGGDNNNVMAITVTIMKSP